MVGGFCGKDKSYRGNDSFFTPKKEWKAIEPYLPKDKVLWEAFYGDGKSGSYLRELGFTVLHEDEDFFLHNKGDIVVSNPPFSKKKDILQRLYTLNKPFCLLMPYDVLFYKYLEPFKPELSLMIPPEKIAFVKDGKEVKLSFNCIWFCWKMNIPKLVFL